jgi:hypothetical protein
MSRLQQTRSRDGSQVCTRRISTTGGESRIWLNACIQSPVASPEPTPRLRKAVEPLKAVHLDLELQGCASKPSCERDKQAGFEPVLPCSLDLLLDEADGGLPVYRQNVIGEADQVHRSILQRGIVTQPHGDAGAEFDYSARASSRLQG